MVRFVYFQVPEEDVYEDDLGKPGQGKPLGYFKVVDGYRIFIGFYFFWL